MVKKPNSNRARLAEDMPEFAQRLAVQLHVLV